MIINGDKGEPFCSWGAARLQGEFDFGEDPPGKRVFDIQIEELKAKAAYVCSWDQNHAWFRWKTLNEACLVVNGARHFLISQTKIWRLSACCTLKSLYLDWTILLLNSKSTLSEYFFDPVLLLTRSKAQFLHLGIDFQLSMHFSHLPLGVICPLPRSGKLCS